MIRPVEWQKLPVSLTELCINTTLRCGQSFRWRKSGEDEWSMALHGRVVSLRQDPEYLYYRALYPSAPNGLPSPPCSQGSSSLPWKDDTLDLIRHYLNLGPNLGRLYEQWASADPNFKKKAPKFTGVRILKQDAWEALVGFICSSNNNIARISQMVEKLCIHYGPLIGHIGSTAFHDFPTPQSLAGPKVEQHLRELGFGYRAKYLHQTAVMIAGKEDADWLEGLRNPESPRFGEQPRPGGQMEEGGRGGYRKAHEELLALQGVGPKVADCVCLMGLGWGEAVPVDTHVWQIAQRDYKFGKGKHSSLTKATYDAVGNRFRGLWGKEAGWAHSVLFTADLRAFSDRLVAKTETVEVKRELDEGGDAVDVAVARTASVKERRVKRERDAGEDEEQLEVARTVMTTMTAKKRRTTRNSMGAF